MRAARLLFFGVGVSEAVRLSGWRAPLRLTVDSAAPPAALAALVRAVEREPEFVPGVRRVRVLDRGAGRIDDRRQTTGDIGDSAAATAEAAGSSARAFTVACRLSPVDWDGWVRYEVQGNDCGLPWTVRFCKAWEGDRRFVWRAEGGTGRPEQQGELMLLPQGTGTRMELRAQTRSALPLLGGAATLLVNPLFLAPAFSGWLRNLARAAGADEG